MQIAQVLSGYTLAAPSMLRRAMGKEKPERMAKRAVSLKKVQSITASMATCR